MNCKASKQTRDCCGGSNAGELTAMRLLFLDHKSAQPCAATYSKNTHTHTHIVYTPLNLDKIYQFIKICQQQQQAIKVATL